MKFITAIAMMVLVQSAFGISEFEKKKKKEMLTRLDTIINTVDSAKDHASKEEAKEACSDLQDLLKTLPEHLKAVGSHMNNTKTKVMIARDEVMAQLIFVHRQTTVCERGENAEHVDSKDLEKKMKKISKSLKKQKKLIEKEHTDYSNEFYYHYEF